MPSVIVIGGGVAGLTTAHELLERGFSVTVYEARSAFGGKARSQPVPGTAGPSPLKELPGEHGFRFYPRFYRHVIDTMARIPDGAGFVADHLQATTQAAIAMIDDSTWYQFNRKELTTPYSLIQALEIFFQDLDFDDEDVSVFMLKLLEFATSCDERRLAEYENITWWDFLEASTCSTKFQTQLRAIPRMMVAMDSKRGSARTIGTITMQLLADFATTGSQNDRTMGGPTSQMWIDPWIALLDSLGVVRHNKRVTSIDVAGGKISGVQLDGGGSATADYYVLAVPIDAAIGLISPAMGALDPVLATLRVQPPDDLVKWMVGVQYYLYEDVPLVRGHLFFPDSPWALTCISQPQFWRGLGLYRRVFGKGDVGGCISVDISEWDTPGTFIPKIAKECTIDEIKSEVWQQLKAALGPTVLTDDLLHSSHLDDDLDWSTSPPTNTSRLLVHPPGSWNLRPEAASAIPNLAIAADYVRTYTNIASMEGANEAGRRAANAIMDKSGSTAGRVAVWPLVEQSWFDGAKQIDKKRFAAGKKHILETFGMQKLVNGAAKLRILEAALGLAKLDDWLDKYKWTVLIRRITDALGIP